MAERQVWKFDLHIEDEQVVAMPEGSELLHVGNQTGAIERFTIWARVDPSNPVVNRRILGRGTGHPIGDEPHIGTTDNGPLVWHIFDGGEVEH